jgi:hypothetical protein
MFEADPLSPDELLKVQALLHPSRKAADLPPVLARDILQAADEFEQTRFMFVFHDDLPEYATYRPIYERTLKNDGHLLWSDWSEYQRIFQLRRDALKQSIIDNVNAAPNLTGTQEAIDNLAQGMTDYLFSNGNGIRYSFVARFSGGAELPLKSRGSFGFKDQENLSNPIPFLCLISLPALADPAISQSFLHDSSFADRLGLPNDHSGLRGVLQHELGHIGMLYTSELHTDWQHERAADMRALGRFYLSGNDQAAFGHLHSRALSNFVSPIEMRFASYWNVLAQMQVDPFSNRLRREDYAAQLEVKQRAAAYMAGAIFLPRIQARDAQQVEFCFNAHSHATVRHNFQPLSMKWRQRRDEALLCALERVVADDEFTHKGSRDLALLTVEAVQRLAPDILADTAARRELADKPRWLVP